MNSELVIPNVTLKDNGVYICTAKQGGSTKHGKAIATVYGEYEIDRFCAMNFFFVCFSK